MHDMSLDALCKAGSAHNAPRRWCLDEGLLSLAPRLPLLHMHTDRPAELVFDGCAAKAEVVR